MCKKKTYTHTDYNFKDNLKPADLEKLRNKVYEQRNFHYENFNKWSKYFYVIIGALFVGYYSTLECGISANMQLLLIVLGYSVSVGWILSNKGYHYWEMHWTYFLLDIEKGMDEAEKIYSVFYYGKEKDGKWKLNNGSYLCPTMPANVSTSKVALIISYIVTFAWGLILINNPINKCLIKGINGWFDGCEYQSILVVVVEVLFVVTCTFIIVFISGHLFHSEIRHGLRNFTKKSNDSGVDGNRIFDDSTNEKRKCKLLNCRWIKKIIPQKTFIKKVCWLSGVCILLFGGIVTGVVLGMQKSQFQESVVKVENNCDELGNVLPLKVEPVNEAIVKANADTINENKLR